jgi:hypothetical protein
MLLGSEAVYVSIDRTIPGSGKENLGAVSQDP